MDGENEMTVQELKQYGMIRANVEALRLQIQNLERPISSPNGNVSVGAGKSSVPNPGNPTERAAFQIIELKEQLQEHEQKQRHALIEIEKWIMKLNNVEAEAIIRWHFILGYTWAETGTKLYKERNSDKARKFFFAFRKENKHLFE